MQAAQQSIASPVKRCCPSHELRTALYAAYVSLYPDRCDRLVSVATSVAGAES